MRVVDRHQRILEVLAIDGSSSVERFSQDFDVSMETVRKDLVYLEAHGKLRRIRGGASRARSDSLNLPLPERASFNRVEKAAIARAACKLIEPRQAVFLDGSSTVLTMTEFFPEIEATVLSNASHVVVALGERPRLHLVCTGGEYEARSRSYTGVLAEESMSRYLIQILFVGVNGFDLERGASEINPGQARLKEKLVSLAEKVCVLADHTKLNTRSAFFFARPSDVDILITDELASLEVVDRIRQLGITVIRARQEA